MLEEISFLKEKIGTFTKARLRQFKRLGKKGRVVFNFRPFANYVYESDIFAELCFCILTANSSVLMGIKLQESIGIEGFKRMSLEELEKTIVLAGHRFARQRAKRIVKARERFEGVLELLRDNMESKKIRELLSNPKSPYKVEGLGLKEASHFLRNIGFEDIAILDRHVLRYLRERNLIPESKTLTKSLYLQAEERLEELCLKLNMSQAELDLYIFYQKTGKVLK